jgi:hypothetical protein
MSRSDPQFNLRIPVELKANVEEAAKLNKRSATAEILARLEESFSPDMHHFVRNTVEPIASGHAPGIEELQLNLEIVLEQVKHMAAAKKK